MPTDDEYDFSGVSGAAADALLNQWRGQNDDDEDDDDDSYFWPDQPPYDIEEKLREINKVHEEDETPVESNRPRTIKFNNRVQMRAISMRKIQPASEEDDDEPFDLSKYTTAGESVADRETAIRPPPSSPRSAPPATPAPTPPQSRTPVPYAASGHGASPLSKNLPTAPRRMGVRADPLKPSRLAGAGVSSPGDPGHQTRSQHSVPSPSRRGRTGFSDAQNSQLFDSCGDADSREEALAEDCLSVLSLTDDETDGPLLPTNATLASPLPESGNSAPPASQKLSSGTLNVSSVPPLSHKASSVSPPSPEVGPGPPVLQNSTTAISENSGPQSASGSGPQTSGSDTGYSSSWSQQAQPPPWQPIAKPPVEPRLHIQVVPVPRLEPAPAMRSLPTQTEREEPLKSSSMPNLMVTCVARNVATTEQCMDISPRVSAERVVADGTMADASDESSKGWQPDVESKPCPPPPEGITDRCKPARMGSAEGSSSGKSDDSAVESMDSRAASDESPRDAALEPEQPGKLAVISYLQRQSVVTADTPPPLPSSSSQPARTHTFNTAPRPPVTARDKPRSPTASRREKAAPPAVSKTPAERLLQQKVAPLAVSQTPAERLLQQKTELPAVSQPPAERLLQQKVASPAVSQTPAVRLLQRPRSAPSRVTPGPAPLTTSAATTAGTAQAARRGTRSGSSGRQVAAGAAAEVALPSAAPRRSRKRTGATSTDPTLTFQEWMAQHELERVRAAQERKNSAKKRRQEADIKKEQSPLAFRVWLRKKRQQKRIEQRLQRLQHQEMLAVFEQQHANSPDKRVAFRQWLQRKQRDRAVPGATPPRATLRCLATLYSTYPGAPGVRPHAPPHAQPPQPHPQTTEPHTQLEQIYAPHGSRCRRTRSAHLPGS